MSIRVRGDQQSYQRHYVPQPLVISRPNAYERRMQEQYLQKESERIKGKDISDKLAS
ncbi:MAG TPA: hypothetical protein VLJ21_02055 [Candidatus Binatia bacterium]|nr:hypothetical protein [Candidatus Binatia bacterium]